MTIPGSYEDTHGGGRKATVSVKILAVSARSAVRLCFYACQARM